MAVKRFRLFAALIISAVSTSAPAAAQSADILLNCTACHGLSEDRRPSYPVLNAQPVLYLIEQLDAYRTGLRAHPQMQRTALALREGGAPAMARMYADAPAPALAVPSQSEDFLNASKLDTEGAWERGIPPCRSCHVFGEGPETSIGLAAHQSPRIHGQPETYLVSTLRAYANGERRTGGLRRMQQFAERLTDEEIAGLAAYFAAFEQVEQRQ